MALTMQYMELSYINTSFTIKKAQKQFMPLRFRYSYLLNQEFILLLNMNNDVTSIRPIARTNDQFDRGMI
jgi:hypothetical protein